MEYWYEKGKLKYDQEIVDFIVNEYYNKHKALYPIADENNWPKSTVRRIFLESGNKVRNDREQALKYTCNENFFEKIDTKEKAYWLGFMYTDGFITNKSKYNNYKIGITLTESDKLHLEKFKNSIEFTGEIKTYKPSPSNYISTKPYSRILISSNKMAEDLIKNGCVINKTFLLKYPDKTIISKDLERHFIRGLLDGDGSLMIKQKNHFTISFTGTKEMCNGILKYFNKENTKLGQRHPERNNNNYSFSIGGNKQVLRLLEDIYKNATIYLDRKYEKYLEMLKISRAKE